MENTEIHNIDIENYKTSSASTRRRTQSPQRLTYNAQVEVIRKQIGDLESVRLSLGLSARKMAQLLMVDPSAWTRWVKEGAPPHVWRALQWYLALKEKIPGLTPQYFLGSDSKALHNEALQRIGEQKKWFEAEIQQLRSVTRAQKRIIYLTVALNLLFVFFVLWHWLASGPSFFP
ncbi:MAG: hypothetical protein N2578_08400 [Bdellovibrionaceae bacterium]|nr:hypothetical protein [Pseudobdellovibrionaceae bacterium]